MRAARGSVFAGHEDFRWRYLASACAASTEESGLPQKQVVLAQHGRGERDAGGASLATQGSCAPKPSNSQSHAQPASTINSIQARSVSGEMVNGSLRPTSVQAPPDSEILFGGEDTPDTHVFDEPIASCQKHERSRTPPVQK